MLSVDRVRVGLSWLAISLGLASTLASAADPAGPRQVAAYNAALPTPSTLDHEHPLSWVLEYARKEQGYLRQTVRDFTCRLVKRERIDDELQDYQYIDMEVREEVRHGERIEKPLSIFLRFAGPEKLAGRKVLFVEGRNDGLMMVRNGGKRFKNVIANLDPSGKSAHRQSLVPIREVGFDRVLGRMIGVLEDHARIDPTGANTQVRQIKGAKLNHRSCTVIRVTHPAKQSGLQFHVANVFVDDSLHVPVRIDFSEWSAKPGEGPLLIAEYTYTDLAINVNLVDADFDPALLRSER